MKREIFKRMAGRAVDWLASSDTNAKAYRAVTCTAGTLSAWVHVWFAVEKVVSDPLTFGVVWLVVMPCVVVSALVLAGWAGFAIRFHRKVQEDSQ
jgi:hypothetical protein